MREPLSKRTKSRSLTKSVDHSARKGSVSAPKKAAPRKGAPQATKLKAAKKPASAKAKVAKAAPGTKAVKGAPARTVKTGTPKAKTASKSASKPVLKPVLKPALKPVSKPLSRAGVKLRATASTKGTAKSSAKASVKAPVKGAVRGAKLPLRPMAPPVAPPPEPVRRQVSTGGVRAFEQALKVFNRRQFAEAKELFEALQHRFPHEVEINARAQTYIQICNQKMTRPNASPRDAEELYDRGVVALNHRDFSQARSLFEKALRLRPNEPHLLYSLAATHAQTGARDQALDYLHRSIQIQPRYRTQAMNDSDFSELHEDKRFLEILGVSSPFDLLEARR